MAGMNGMSMMLKSMGIDVDKLQEPVMQMAAGVASIEKRLANIERAQLQTMLAQQHIINLMEGKSGPGNGTIDRSANGSDDSADGSGNPCNPSRIECACCNGGSASCDSSSGISGADCGSGK